MKLNLLIYVAQPQKGHFRASIPYVEALALPVEGTSPAQLKEELMFRALELVHGGANPAQLDMLLGPKSLQLLNIFVEFERKVDPQRPPVELSAWTHVLVGRQMGDDLVHVWIPTLPGECFALEHQGQVYDGACAWAEQWAEEYDVSDLKVLSANYPARIEAMEIDLGFPAADPRDAERAPPGGRLRRPEALVQVATNLTRRADDQSRRAAYGRDQLVEELVEVMTASRPAHVCLVGPKGAGKSALVEEAVRQTLELQRAYQQRRDIWQTSGDRVIAGMSIIGQWEQRTEQLCAELEERGDLLVIDDLLGLVRAGRTFEGDSSVAGFIEPYLDQGRFGLIAEATAETFEAARSEAPGFVDRLRRIQIPALNARETLAVLNELVRALEASHRVRFTADAVEAIVRLSGRYFRQEAYPGKAIRLARQCFSAAVRMLSDEAEFEVLIDPRLVARVVQQQTGLPMTLLVPGQGRSPQDIERAFSRRVFDQPEATELISALILATEQGLCDPKRPLGSFLLIGPSGVGKTETARALAQDLFGGPERLVRFDMSEFATPLAATRLIGTAQEPDGELTGRVRIQPFCVLLFDEVEKAHPAALDLLLQLLGDGRLTDAAGRTVDFSNTVVLMTSNLGAGAEERWVGFSQKSVAERSLHYRRAAEEFFRPELFNRIDRVLAYRPLGLGTLRRIAERTLSELLQRRGFRHGNIMVDVAHDLVEHLVGASQDQRYGARTLSHRIEQRLITPLARALAAHPYQAEQDEGLTRAMLDIEPDGEVSLRLISLEKAAPVEPLDPGAQRFLDERAQQSLDDNARRLAARLQELIDGFERLEASAWRRQIDADYERSLGALNASASTGQPLAQEPGSYELAEMVRQREIFRQTTRALGQRLDALVDPEQSGAREVPDVDAFEAPQLHRWHERTSQLFGHLSWARAQARALTARPTDAATLIIEGLSGDIQPLLADWQRWLDAFAQPWELNLAAARRVHGRWELIEPENGAEYPDEPRELHGVSALAFSSEYPGISAVFKALSGYFWAPKLASHGQHGLALLTAKAAGSADSARLLELLEAEPAQPAPQESAVEFILRDAQITQPRLGARLVLPAARAQPRRFVEALIFGRLALEFDPAELAPARTSEPDEEAENP